MRTITKADKPKISGRGRQPDKGASKLVGQIIPTLKGGDEDTVIALSEADVNSVGKSDASLTSKRGTLQRALDREAPDFAKVSAVQGTLYVERNGETS